MANRNSNAAPSYQTVIPHAPTDRVGDKLPQNVEDSAVRQQIICTELLLPDDLEIAKGEAQQFYESLIVDTVAFMNYGKSAVAELNALIRDFHSLGDAVDVEEVQEGLKQFRKKTDDLSNKYDVSDPHVKARVQRDIAGKGRRLFGQAKSIFERFEIDRQDTEQLIDSIETTVLEKKDLLLEHIARQDLYFEQTQEEILDMIHVIAVMELILEKAQSELAGLRTSPPAEMSQHQVDTRTRTLTAFIHNLTRKITEYRNRMWVGQSSAQQIMNRRDGHVSLVMKLDNQLELTVPLMRGAVDQWKNQIEAMKTGDLVEGLDDEVNKWVVKAAEADAEMTPRMFELGAKPTLRAESIARIGEVTAEASDSLADIIHKVKDIQNDTTSAMLEANRLMRLSGDKITDAALDDIMHKATSRLSRSFSEEEE